METEYKLWQAAIEGPMQWGHDTITLEDIAALVQLSEIAGGWIAWPDGADEEQFVALEEWQPIYALWAKTQETAS